MPPALAMCVTDQTRLGQQCNSVFIGNSTIGQGNAVWRADSPQLARAELDSIEFDMLLLLRQICVELD